MGEEWGDAASRLAALREVRLEYQVASITPCDVSSISLIVFLMVNDIVLVFVSRLAALRDEG